MTVFDPLWAQPPFGKVCEMPADPPVGTVVPYAGELDAGFLHQQSWRYCDGSALCKSAYPELYLAIGDTYGNAPSESEFLLPDYRGLFHRGLDTTDRPGGPRDPGIASRTNQAGETNAGVGSLQDDAFEEHEHTYTPNRNLEAPVVTDGAPVENLSLATKATTTAVACTPNAAEGSDSCYGAETRPKNMYVYYLIKARSSHRLLEIPAWPGWDAPW